MAQTGTTAQVTKFERSYVRKYNVRLSSDRKTSGCSRIDDGYIVLGDYNNSKLKLFDPNFMFVMELPLPGHPWHLCRTEGCTIAITVNDGEEWEGNKNEVYIMEVQDRTIKPVRKLTLNHKCCGVAYNNGELYVGTRNALYKYSMTGQLVKQVYEDKSDANSVWKFAVSKDGSKIYIPNMCRRLLVTIDSYGMIETIFNQKTKLAVPTAATVLPDGSVIACGLANNTIAKIIKVDQAGEKLISTIATQHDGLYNPKSLYVHPSSSELLVGQECDTAYIIGL